MPDNPLQTIMAPRSIAIVGASNNPTKMGTIQYLNLRHSGFPGPVYPIHPKETQIFGVEAYPRIEDLPEVPDLAMLVVPSHLVPDMIERFGALGTRHAVIITAGFKEIGAEGAERQARLDPLTGVPLRRPFERGLQRFLRCGHILGSLLREILEESYLSQRCSHSLTRTQFCLLKLITLNADLHPSQVARYLGVTPAAITKNVHIRAGSCVATLHHPIRIAEDWSLVDHLANGLILRA
mgnify:CR=1 FL=1